MLAVQKVQYWYVRSGFITIQRLAARCTRTRSHQLQMQTTPCGSERETVAVTIILRRNETTGHDEVFLEERLVPATGGGTIGLVGGKLDHKDVEDVRKRCLLENLDMTSGQFSDEVAKVTNMRELREEVEFTDEAGQPLTPLVQGPFGRLKLANYEYVVFKARIPPSASVGINAAYAPRVRSVLWTPFMEALADRDPRIMPSTVPLLGLYLYLEEVRCHMANFQPPEKSEATKPM